VEHILYSKEVFLHLDEVKHRQGGETVFFLAFSRSKENLNTRMHERRKKEIKAGYG
jgi:hypothetical protein